MTCVVYESIWSNKNLKSPEEVSLNSHIKYTFVCHICNHEYEQCPHSKTGGRGCPYCSGHKICGECKSCLSKSCNIYEDIWSDKNEILPEMVARSSNKKYSFDCCVCHHTYEQQPANKTNGQGCPYCSNNKLCGSLDCKFCSEKSCHVYIDIWSVNNVTIDGIYIKPETVSISNDKKYIFNCDICNHVYDQAPGSKTSGRGCPYCSNQKLCGTVDCEFCLKKSCYVYKDIWSCKNTKPEKVAISCNKKFIFDCKVCKEEYEQSPGKKTHGRGCPNCVNKTEQKVADHLKEIGINFKQQYKIGNINKFYDFYLSDYKLIIEVDGPQHFRQVSNWNCPKDTLENDVEKMKVALLKGISVLRIYQPDIWSDKIDWKTCVKENLHMRTIPTVVTIACNPQIYNNHVNFL